MANRAWVGRKYLASLLAAAALLSVVGTGAASGTAVRRLAAPTADGAVPVIPEGTTVAAAQAWLTSALQARATQLVTLSNALSQSTGLSGSDKSAFASLLASDMNGISAITVSNDSSLAAVRADTSTMVLNFQIFAIVMPTVRLAVSISTVLSKAQNVNGLIPGIEAAIAADSEAHKQVARASMLESTVAARLSDAANQTQNALDALENLTAASYPGSAAVIANAQRQRARAATDVRVATNNVNSIVTLLERPALTQLVARSVNGAKVRARS